MDHRSPRYTAAWIAFAIVAALGVGTAGSAEYAGRSVASIEQLSAQLRSLPVDRVPIAGDERSQTRGHGGDAGDAPAAFGGALALPGPTWSASRAFAIAPPPARRHRVFELAPKTSPPVAHS